MLQLLATSTSNIIETTIWRHVSRRLYSRLLKWKYDKLYDGCNWTKVTELLNTKTLPFTTFNREQWLLLSQVLALVYLRLTNKAVLQLSQVETVRLKPQLLFLSRYTVQRENISRFCTPTSSTKPSTNEVPEGDDALLFLLHMKFQREMMHFCSFWTSSSRGRLQQCYPCPQYPLANGVLQPQHFSCDDKDEASNVLAL